MKNILEQAAAEVGAKLNVTQIEMFMQYKDLLLEWNKKMNLTSITDEQEIMVKHFADSLSLVPFIEHGKSLIDVGTGAGFPGVPLKIAMNSLNVTLLDSLKKRLLFANAVIDELGLSEIRTVHTRAEDGANSELREKYDYAVARAVSRLQVLAEYCLPYVKTGGVFIAYKGADVKIEVADAEAALKVLGGTVVDIKEIRFFDIHHSLIMIKKVRQTPPKYPRSPAKIAQHPIK